MPRPSSLPLILAVMGVGAGALAMLNFAQYQNRPRTQEELQQEMMERQKTDQEKSPPSPAPTEQSPANVLVTFKSDTTLGAPQAPKSFTVGYEWTPEVQADPMRVYGPIQMIEKMSRGMVRIRIVNLSDPDAPRVPPGLSDGKRVLLPLRSEGGFDPQSMQRTMPELMKMDPPR